MLFISKKAKVSGSIEGEAVVLGPSEVGGGSVIGNNVVIGYPIRRKILQVPNASFLEYVREKLAANAKRTAEKYRSDVVAKKLLELYLTRVNMY